MTLSIPELIALAAAILVLGILVHKYLPTGAVAKAEGQLVADVRGALPAAETFGLKALSDVEMWLSDTHSKDAAIAKLQAEKAQIQAAIRAHIAKLSAALPPL